MGRVCDYCFKKIILERMKSNGLLSLDEYFEIDCAHRHSNSNEQSEENVDVERFYGINRKWRRVIAHNYEKLDPFDDELKQLIKAGIPSVIRGHIWLQMVNLNGIKNESAETETKQDNESKEDIYALIEKDLQRTFPIHSCFKIEKNIDCLREILTKYAVRNPVIGYCQSMNFLGAICLLFLDNQTGFAMFAHILEKICCLFDEYFYHQTDI